MLYGKTVKADRQADREPDGNKGPEPFPGVLPASDHTW